MKKILVILYIIVELFLLYLASTAPMNTSGPQYDKCLYWDVLVAFPPLKIIAVIWQLPLLALIFLWLENEVK